MRALATEASSAGIGLHARQIAISPARMATDRRVARRMVAANRFTRAEALLAELRGGNQINLP